MNKCKFCKKTHGIIGDIVCPIKSISNFFVYPKVEFYACEWHYEPDRIPNHEGRERFKEFSSLLDVIKPGIENYRGGRKKGTKNKPKPQTGSSPGTPAP